MSQEKGKHLSVYLLQEHHELVDFVSGYDNQSCSGWARNIIVKAAQERSNWIVQNHVGFLHPRLLVTLKRLKKESNGRG